MVDFLKKTYNILKTGFVSRIYMNAIGCMLLGLSIGCTNILLRFGLLVIGAIILADTWYNFGYRRATVINALKN